MTWFSTIDNDFLNSKEICKQLEIDQILIKIEKDSLFKKIKSNLPASPEIPIFFRNIMDISEKRIIEKFGENTYFLNGHGGDHIFLQHMPKTMMYHFIKSRKYQDALRFIDNQNMNYLSILFYIVTSPFISKNKISLEHNNAIDMAIFDNVFPLFSSTKSNIEFPFTNKNIIEASLKIPYEMLFHKKLSRYFPRLALYDLFKHEIFFREDKSVNTDIFQKNLSYQYDYIEYTIKNGIISKNNLFNIEKVLFSLKENSLGLSGFNRDLANVIATELLVQSFLELKNEIF